MRLLQNKSKCDTLFLFLHDLFYMVLLCAFLPCWGRAHPLPRGKCPQLLEHASTHFQNYVSIVDVETRVDEGIPHVVAIPTMNLCDAYL